MEKLSEILQVAKDILQDYGLKGLHVCNITEIAIKKNKNMGLSSDDFQKKLQSALASHIKTKIPQFAKATHDKGAKKGKPKQGWYRIKITRTPANPIQSEPIEQISTQFSGKAGEYAVMSELLFHGFNTSIMTVDDGIDLVVSKDEKFFKIQVKTAQPQVNKFQFSINKKSFNKYNTADVFYIFVLREFYKNSYIIIPYTQLNYFIHARIIQVGVDKISFSISYDEKQKKYLLNNNADIHQYYRNFSAIR